MLIPNYHITQKINESAYSLIYRAIREEDHQSVILKILKEDYPSPEKLTCYQQEYERLRQLSDISGVINVYSLEKYQNTLLMCLEDFGGTPLKPTFSFEDMFKLAIRITDILGQIHKKNIIHQNINPSNLIFNPSTDTLKFIDFGVLEHNLAYISPEQTERINGLIDYRTDFYALGVTFYELFTGVLPFDSKDAMELIHCHIAKKATPPAHLPPAISNIIMKLLEKNADKRYQSIWGLQADLEKFKQNPRDWDFELAQYDLSERFQIQQKLYGRTLEKEKLQTAFERVTKGKAEIMLISGDSGMGKSALVKEIYKSFTQKQGHFISGKFDQFQHDIPYSAIIYAIEALVQQVLTETEAQLAHWKEKLLKALGINGQIIIDVIPHIELIIGKQPAPLKLEATESQNRFNLVFKNFIRVFCQAEQPLVIFGDDLQWIDLATLNLLELVMTDVETRNLLFIGAYRNNEVDMTHPLLITLDSLHKKHVIINKIALKPLTSEYVTQLIADSLHQHVKEVDSLSDLVWHKTGGNPFFVTQFLQTLYEEKLLFFVLHKSHWQWDINNIEAMDITDNVVELMIKKIKKLPDTSQNVLRLAACMGNRFDVNTLSVIYEKSAMATFQDLKPVLREALIFPISENNSHNAAFIHQLQFSHDRVQQAAYALIDDKHKKAIHLQIARLLFNNTQTAVLAEKVFEIVGHFNQSIALIDTHIERLQVAKLNIIAGKKAKMATAYEAALKYFLVGRKCLHHNSWKSDYDLIFNLFIEAAEAAYLNGNFKQVEQLVHIALQHVHSLSDAAKICEIRIFAYDTQYKARQAIDTALVFLKQLGIIIPEEPTQEDVGVALQELHLLLSETPIQSLVNLPIMRDTQTILAMRIIVAVIVPAYAVSPNIMTLLILKQVHLSFTYGNVAESSFSYVAYGMILSSIGKIDSGYQFGLLALALLKRLDENKLKARTIFVFNSMIKLWKSHVRETLQPLLDNYKTALDTGNINFAAYSININLQHAYFVGKPLLSLESDMVLYRYSVDRRQQEYGLKRYCLLWQVVLNLLGYSDNPCRLIGKVYDENIPLSLLQEENDKTTHYYLYINKCILHYLFHEYGPALENTKRAEQYLEGVTGLLGIAIFYFYDSLVRLALSQSDNVKISANQEKLKKWADHAPMNYLHKFYLVEAERCRVSGKDGEAREFYDKAIALAHENEYINEEALAYELAGQFYLAKKEIKFAKLCLYEAHYAYQKWGALAKVTHLEKKYPQFIETTAFSATIDHSEALDLKSIMKAAQILSGEIVLSQLLEKMINIVIENVGAEKCFLLLPKQNSWFIEAQGHIDHSETIVLHSLSLEHVSANMIHYVARTQDSIVLHNATQKGAYQRDAYIIKHRPQSVLCTPLINQGQLIGILYLENNLTTGAFTPKSLKVLKTLSSHIAISIENSLLYNNLEARVIERTKELRENKRAMQTLISNLPGVAYRCLNDHHWTMLFMSKSTFVLTGYSVSAFISGHINYIDIIHADDLEYVQQTVQDAIQKKQMFTLIYRIFTKTKKVKWIGEQGQGVFDQQGKLISIEGLMNDITEHKQTEINLQHAKKIAETANKAKSTFLASMSHELRTPLNAVLGYAQILQQDSSINEKQQHGLHIIEQSGNYLLTLINEILDLAKIETGKLALYEKDFNLPLLLNTIREMINIRAKLKGIDFYLETMYTLPKGVHGDKQRLQQILLNLLGNAIKFTDQGSVTLHVNFKNPNFLFKIEDTGVGIAAENMNRIFEPFEQVGEQKRQTNGTGLGLAISKKFVELMGGQLHVSSDINIGTQFWFKLALPVVTYHATTRAAPQPIIGIKEKSPKILIIDDNLDNQAVLVDLLAPLGFEVQQSNNGYEGLKKAKQWRPELIMTDLIMPEMDGFEFIRQVRQSLLLKKTRIIVTSASAYIEDTHKSLALGANSFLSKPIQVETLFQQLQQLLKISWIYGKKKIVTENHLTQIVFPPRTILQTLYKLSLMGDIDELEEQASILVQSNVIFQPFLTKIHSFLKEYQLDECSAWIERELIK